MLHCPELSLFGKGPAAAWGNGSAEKASAKISRRLMVRLGFVERPCY
jgi:hypothetical protein